MRNDFMAVNHGKPQARRGDRPGGRGYAEEGRGHAPRQGQPEGRRGDGPRGEKFAEGRGHGPRDGQFQGRGRGDVPRGRTMGGPGITAENGPSKGGLSQSEFDQASRHVGRLLILE
jgi:hypothetical protein